MSFQQKFPAEEKIVPGGPRPPLGPEGGGGSGPPAQDSVKKITARSIPHHPSRPLWAPGGWGSADPPHLLGGVPPPKTRAPSQPPPPTVLCNSCRHPPHPLRPLERAPWPPGPRCPNPRSCRCSHIVSAVPLPSSCPATSALFSCGVPLPGTPLRYR